MSGMTPEQLAAKARWAARRRRLIGYGQWEPFVDSEPVRVHVRAVQATGMPLKAMESRLNLPQHTFKHLLWGSKGDGPSLKIRTETAQVVLAYWPSLDDYPDTALIDPTGTQRRAQALAVMGWTNTWMAEQLGMRPSNFNRGLTGDRVTARMARVMRDVYNQFWRRTPNTDEVQDWVSERTRRRALEQGWHGPLAWDDDTIDDPNALPQTDAVAPIVTDGPDVAARWLMGESVVLGTESRKEVLAHLFEWTQQTPEEIAEQIGMTPGSASMAWERLKRRAREEGQPVPWRRAYWLRDKELTTNEMEQTA